MKKEEAHRELNMADRIALTITRRKLTEILMGLVALFLTVSVVAAILKYLWPQTSSVSEASMVRITAVDDVPVGITGKPFVFHGKAALLLHMPAGFRCFGAVCTHLGCIVNSKLDDGDILCPCHLSRFDPNTGAVISGPAPSRLPTIDVEVREGTIYALKWKDLAYVISIPFYAGAA